jgi:hypothetical protein
MAMTARKESSKPKHQTAQGTVIEMMPRLPKHLQSLMSQESSKTSFSQLRVAMTSLHASLPSGSLWLLANVIRRSGRGFGVPTWCLFCEAKPPKDMHRTDLRRRWQSLHYAMHIKKGDTPQDFEVHEGDVGRK